jgi:hypothetical protein
MRPAGASHGRPPAGATGAQPARTRDKEVITVGLFSAPKVPNTISDKQRAELHRRANKAATESMFSKRNVERRKASQNQRSKSIWS